MTLGRIRYGMAMALLAKSPGRSFESCLKETDSRSVQTSLDDHARELVGQQDLSQVENFYLILIGAQVLPCKAVNQRRDNYGVDPATGLSSLFSMKILELQQCVSAIGGVASGFAYMRKTHPGAETEATIAATIQKLRDASLKRHVPGKTSNRLPRPSLKLAPTSSSRFQFCTICQCSLLCPCPVLTIIVCVMLMAPFCNSLPLPAVAGGAGATSRNTGESELYQAFDFELALIMHEIIELPMLQHHPLLEEELQAVHSRATAGKYRCQLNPTH